MLILPSGSALAIVVILAAVVALMFVRPRLLLIPIRLGSAFWAWMRPILSFPMVLRAYLEAATIAKHLEALHLSASTAATMWTTSADLRPAARELFGRVLHGHGIRPSEPPPVEKGNPFARAAVAHAASSINAAGPGKPKDEASSSTGGK